MIIKALVLNRPKIRYKIYFDIKNMIICSFTFTFK